MTPLEYPASPTHTPENTTNQQRCSLQELCAGKKLKELLSKPASRLPQLLMLLVGHPIHPNNTNHQPPAQHRGLRSAHPLTSPLPPPIHTQVEIHEAALDKTDVIF